MLVLTVVTGLIDAVSYMALGRVFVANMTGNVVFLGFALAGAPGCPYPPPSSRWSRSSPELWREAVRHPVRGAPRPAPDRDDAAQAVLVAGTVSVVAIAHGEVSGPVRYTPHRAPGHRHGDAERGRARRLGSRT
ncbi:hypothetical protein GCM10023238_22610 [Streptomyces heliomycini]